MLGGLAIYAKIAWWGIVAPRVERKPLVVLQGVIVGAEGVLLSVRADLRGWELPGGNLEPGESFEAALRREVREETGLSIVVERHVGDYVRTGFRPHVAKVYRCAPVGGTLQAQRSEVRALRWFQPEAVPDKLFTCYREPLDRGLGEPREPVILEERQGALAILAGLAIDLRMRATDDSAGLH